MSADKYAQFIAEQQRKLSVSGVNAVDLHETKKPEVTMHGGAAHVKNADGEVVASYSRKEHGKDYIKKANAHMAKLPSGGSKLKEEVLDEKMDPVGKEDEDVNNDGKSDGTDKYLKNRRAAIASKMKKEEVETVDEAKARSSDYLGTVDRDDPDYDKKIGEFKKGHKLRIRGRLGKDNPNAPMYRQGGKLHRSSSLDVKPEHSKRVDVYTRGERKMKKEEVELISIEEQTYIEEMVGKGKLPSILQHHKDAMNHHQKIMDHHSMMADKSESVGDHEGFDYHLNRGMEAEGMMRHHMARFDHASSLGAKAKAHKQIKAAKEAMGSAEKALQAAKSDKRDW
jgi:hypothetical protein